MSFYSPYSHHFYLRILTRSPIIRLIKTVMKKKKWHHLWLLKTSQKSLAVDFSVQKIDGMSDAKVLLKILSEFSADNKLLNAVKWTKITTLSFWPKFRMLKSTHPILWYSQIQNLKNMKPKFYHKGHKLSYTTTTLWSLILKQHRRI